MNDSHYGAIEVTDHHDLDLYEGLEESGAVLSALGILVFTIFIRIPYLLITQRRRSGRHRA